jgi:hypothetical protein
MNDMTTQDICAWQKYMPLVIRQHLKQKNTVNDSCKEETTLTKQLKSAGFYVPTRRGVPDGFYRNVKGEICQINPGKPILPNIYKPYLKELRFQTYERAILELPRGSDSAGSAHSGSKSEFIWQIILLTPNVINSAENCVRVLAESK